jgi:Protein of unknown function (DUF2892)
MSAMRMVFLAMAALILLGIWLTGFGTAHWLLYVPVAGLFFAGVTGYCPSYMLFRKLGLKGTSLDNKV